MTSSYKLRYGGATHIGMKRKQNQDHFMCIPDIAAFIVCDGMGGHRGGETASLTTVTTVCDSIRAAKSAAAAGRGPQWSPRDALRRSILDANVQVQGRSRVDPDLAGMGTTCTVLFFDKGTAYIGHVGDSRAYMIHPGRIWQLTRDHSLVQEKLRAGLITREQLKTDRMKNVITRSVGFENQVDIDIYSLDVQPGDHFLLCSDGLTGMCDDVQIAQIVTDAIKGGVALESVTKTLCDAANLNGGDDNITSILVHID